MTARHSSAECYHSASFQNTAHSDREIIAELVRKRGPMTRREIAGFLSMETSSVAGRVNELMSEEPPVLVEIDEKRPCPITKRLVTWVQHAEDAAGHQMGLRLV